MSAITDKIKEKSIGGYLMAGASLFGLIITIMYIAFGASAGEFTGGIFVCFLFGFLLSVAALVYEGIPTDAFVFVAVALLTLGLGLFLHDSINDFADFVANMDLFGRKENTPMRIVIIVFAAIDILVTIVSAFFKRTKQA